MHCSGDVTLFFELRLGEFMRQKDAAESASAGFGAEMTEK